eukprot:9983073-Heterocapsa_arctica.AAC.1
MDPPHVRRRGGRRRGGRVGRGRDRLRGLAQPADLVGSTDGDDGRGNGPASLTGAGRLFRPPPGLE